MDTNFKPMLAGTVEDITKLPYPMLASPKLDGIRALVIDGVLMSRNLKPIPNKHLQKLFGKAKYNGFDGELLLNSETIAPQELFRFTSSAVMRAEGEPDVIYWVFDHFAHGATSYEARVSALTSQFRFVPTNIRLLPSLQVNGQERLKQIEEEWLEKGFEGVMLRKDMGAYKYGRSTLREGYLLKLKRFCDGEAEVVGYEEQQENTNEKTTDALGHSKRSSHKAGKVAKGTLGSLVVRDVKTKVEFNIGTGFDDGLRATLWGGKDKLKGLFVKYKYFPTGSKEKPRFPVFIGFRSAIDF